MKSKFILSWGDALSRLEATLSEASFTLVQDYADRCAEEEVVLWIDEPWVKVDYDTLASDTPVALAIFTEAIDVEEGLALSAAQLLGEDEEREEIAFVFLSGVRAEALTTLPGTTAVFSGGLEVESAACLQADGCTTHVAKRLRAAMLFAGHAEGELLLEPETQLEVQQLCGAFGGTLVPSKLFEFAADEIEHAGLGAAIDAINAGHLQVPEGFVWPGHWAPPRFSYEFPEREPELLDAEAYKSWRDTTRMSEEGRALLRGMDSYLLLGAGARRVHAFPSAEELYALDERVLIVDERVVQEGPLHLRAHPEDGWRAYVFKRPVHCSDVLVDFNVLAVFSSSLLARTIVPAAVTHVLVENLEASVVDGLVYVRSRSPVKVGVIAGSICRSVDAAELLPHWAAQLEDGLPLWTLFAESIEQQSALTPEEDETADEPEPTTSRFTVERTDALARLKKANLAKESSQMLEHFAKRSGGAVLFVDEPWDALDYEELATDEAVSLVVFTEAFTCDGPMTLNMEELVGDTRMRNDCAFVFLGEVRAEAFTTRPDTLAVFAGGLVVESAACFSAADASTHVAKILSAPTVISGNSDGTVQTTGRCRVEIERLIGSVEGFKVAKSKRVTMANAYPRWAEALEDVRLWELFSDAFAAGDSVEPES